VGFLFRTTGDKHAEKGVRALEQGKFRKIGLCCAEMGEHQKAAGDVDEVLRLHPKHERGLQLKATFQ
jgi:hypothetical protein